MLNITVSDWKGGSLLQHYMKNKQTKELFFIFQLKTVLGSLNITLTIILSDWEGGYLLQHCMEKQKQTCFTSLN